MCFHKIETDKTKIVIGDTYCYGLSHLEIHHNDFLSDKSCPHFTVTRDGNIYQHFDINYYSEFMNLNAKQIVSIGLENVSVLNKVNNKYYDIFNNEYLYPDNVFFKKWKNLSWWIPYTKQQTESLIYLLLKLKSELIIDNWTVRSSNVFDKGIRKLNGVMYKSNFDKKHLDPNPSLDFNKINENLNG